MVTEWGELVHGRVLVHARPGGGRCGRRHGRLLLLRGGHPLLLLLGQDGGLGAREEAEAHLDVGRVRPPGVALLPVQRRRHRVRGADAVAVLDQVLGRHRHLLRPLDRRQLQLRLLMEFLVSIHIAVEYKERSCRIEFIHT